MSTVLSIQEDKFLINDKLVYSEVPTSSERVHGLLMNARFIQGIYSDSKNSDKYKRYGFEGFEAETNTDDLIEALPQWYSYGLRAFTVGMQGGGPCFTISNQEIENNPYSADGKEIDEAYLSRLLRLIKAADDIGMIVVVSLFYGDQTRGLKNNAAVKEAVIKMSTWLKETGYKNLIIEIANEHNLISYKRYSILHEPFGIVELMRTAKEHSGGIPVGCSGLGGYFNEAIAEASDIIIIHGNGCTRQRYKNLIAQCQAISPKKPIVCNEDSQAIDQLQVAFDTQTSWGYYNNMTKQEPPVRWGITEGEDKYFAMRMAQGLGIPTETLSEEESYYLQGLEAHMTDNGKRWIRVAALYPEQINYVEFYRNNAFIDVVYDVPFSLGFKNNWQQEGIANQKGKQVWEAHIYLRNGKKIVKQQVVEDSVYEEV